MGKTIDIGGRIHNPEVGNVVTGANEILDDTKNKKQDVINSEVDAALEALDTNKQDNLTFDQTPTESSTNPVTSGGVYAADLELQQAIEAILTLIPSAASALNQLADKSFVNSSIATASATFRGTYNLVSDLHLSVTASHQDIATALASVVSTADNNDYCFVQIPTSDTSSDIRVTERYKFNGTAWQYEYDLNNSGFTAQQWEAINSGITALLVTKLGALPTAAELATSLAGKQNVLTFDNVPVSGSDNPVKSGGLYQLFAAIDAKFPSDASSSNKLVAENRLAAYVTAIIEALDASFDLTSADGHVTFKMTQSNGVIASVQILTSDIASASALTTLGGQVSTNASDIAALQALYNALQQSAPQIIEPTDTWPVANPSTTVIYRVVDRVNTPPQYYSDYMWNGSTWVLMATYNNAIDAVPTAGSNNLVKSGGVVSFIEEKEKLTTTAVHDGYLRYINGNYGWYAQGYFETLEYSIPCKEGETFIFKGFFGNAALGVLFLDNERNIVSHISRSTASELPIKVTVPSGINFITFLSFRDFATQNNFVFNVVNLDKTGVVLFYDDMDEIVGYVNRGTGGITTDSGFHSLVTDIIPCEEGDIFYYRGRGFSATASVVFYNDGGFVSALQIDNTDKNFLSKVIVPSGVNGVKFASVNEANLPIVLDVVYSYHKVIELIANMYVYNSQLFGKKINWLGDSYIANNGQPVSDTWHYLIGEKYSMTYRNYGINGNAIVGGTNPMSERYVNMDADADYVMIVGGTNDYNLQVPIDTFKTGLSTFIENLVNRYPLAKIAFWTPFNNKGMSTYTIPLGDYSKAIKEVCGLYGVPCFDALKEGGLFAWNPSVRIAYFQGANDYAHLNADGHKFFVTRAEGFLNSL